jgi:hypothetical protein
MSDPETEFSDPAHFFDEKATHFSQVGQLSDPSLTQLRDQIKKVMIPLLIKTFQFKLELNQSLSLPSRIQSQKNHRSPEEIIEQLKTLDNDLKMLGLWCQSCRGQIQKALVTPEEEQKNKVALSPVASTNPAVAKSFSETVSAQSSFFQQNYTEKKVEESPLDTHPSPLPKRWWEKLMRK